MKRTDDIIDLKNCIDGVQDAMANEDYTAAAKFVNRYLNFDKSILDKTSVDLLETAERSLADIVRIKCDSAIASSDTDLVLKFALLMPLMGQPAQGIEKLTLHFSKLLAKDESAIYAEMEKSSRSTDLDQKISYFAAVGQLLHRLERRWKRFRAQLETAFGRVGLAQLLTNVQSHVNERGLNLLELFVREWQLQSTVCRNPCVAGQTANFNFQLNTISRQQPSKGSATLSTALSRGNAALEYRDPREYAPLLDQIVGISQSFESYSRFTLYLVSAPTATGALKPDEETADENLLEVKKALSASFSQSRLNERLHEVLGWYVRLEQYYMDEAVKMAVVEDQLPALASMEAAKITPGNPAAMSSSNPDSEDAHSEASSSLTSSIVDDVFFVVKECLQRAQMTYNVNTVCAIVNLADQQMSGLFLDTLAANSKQQSTIQTFTRKAASTPASIAVALNNLKLSEEYAQRSLSLRPSDSLWKNLLSYLQRLTAEVESSVQQQFTANPKEVQKIAAVLDQIHQTEKRFSHVRHGNMELLASSLLPRLQASLETHLIDAQYVLDEQEYSQNQINDPYMRHFIADVEATLAPFQQFMVATNAEALNEILARSFAEQIEAHLLLQSSTVYSSTSVSNEKNELKRFNLLGAQQLDREIRDLLGFFTATMVSKTVRDKFARINQISFLLNLEKETEVLDYWGAKTADGLSWRLSPSEVRKILALRVDFGREAIVKLKL